MRKRTLHRGLTAFWWLTLAFLYLPLAVVVLFSFNATNSAAIIHSAQPPRTFPRVRPTRPLTRPMTCQTGRGLEFLAYFRHTVKRALGLVIGLRQPAVRHPT